MSWIQAWKPYFSSRMRMVGRVHQSNDCVQRISVANGELANFVVQVDDQTSFEVQMTAPAPTRPVATSCTCAEYDAKGLCEHIWAALVDVEQYPSGRSEEHQALDFLTPQSPRARKRAGGIATATRQEPSWASRLTLLRGSSAGGDVNATPQLPIQRKVCYVVLPEESARRGHLVIELRYQQPTRDGWSTPKPLKISAQGVSQLTEPVDRQLCALLLGPSPIGADAWDTPSAFVTGRAHTIFELPSGGQHLLLYRMIQTGRCLLADGDQIMLLMWDADPPDSQEVPVHAVSLWDFSGGSADTSEDEVQTRPPWALWLRAKEEISEDEEALVTGLQFRLELRRQGHRMPVENPLLVLGGHDGLVIYDGKVAPFHDHGAGQWVGHFRDEVARHGEVEPIAVSIAEVPQFLDRLYRLAQIPEVDLPESIGWHEQRIKPMPQIEIFSPPSADDTATAGRTPRGTLTARPWFAYAQGRVVASQPGRFVTDAAEEVSAEASATPGSTPGSTPEAPPQAASETSPQATPEAPKKLVRRDLTLEHDYLAWLLTIGFKQNPTGSGDLLSLSAKHLSFVVSELLAHGWGVKADQRVVRQAGPARMSVSSGIDWFELRGKVKFETESGEEEVSLPQLLAAARAGQTMIELSDGSHGLLPQEWLSEHGLLASIGQEQDDHLRFQFSQAAILDGLLRKQELVSVDETFSQARQRLHDFAGIEPQDPSPTFCGELRPYQRDALGWFEFLRQFAMGGILADDMGLGKTVQVLAMIESRSQNKDFGPILIVAPRSVVFNWIDEAERFAPHLRVLAYTGNEREALREEFKNHDIVITSYGLMRRDVAALRSHAFDYVVLDEAQTIKNPSSQSAKAARLLNTSHRLALTGTPVENHLGDLWSIFEFLNPGFLGSSLRFGQLVRGEAGPATLASAPGSPPGSAPAEITADTEIITESPLGSAPTTVARAIEKPRNAGISAQIAQALRPFILRRTKKQVLKDLPDKIEQTIVCEMEPAQRQMYDELRMHFRKSLLGGGGGGSMMVLEALLRLRQAACHPGLIDPARVDEPSAKLEALIDSLVELIDEGHKALVFSQFVGMLSIVRKRLDDLGITYEYLDGQTRDRKRRVDRFQEDPDCPAFLISLKAGGLGLNLTAAEYVFILDPWWNPAVEQQAIDRTHRIGQTRHVMAYRMICQDTVEQRIIELQKRKRQLADAIVGGEQSPLRNLTRDELESLLS